MTQRPETFVTSEQKSRLVQLCWGSEAEVRSQLQERLRSLSAYWSTCGPTNTVSSHHPSPPQTPNSLRWSLLKRQVCKGRTWTPGKVSESLPVVDLILPVVMAIPPRKPVFQVLMFYFSSSFILIIQIQMFSFSNSASVVQCFLGTRREGSDGKPLLLPLSRFCLGRELRYWA